MYARRVGDRELTFDFAAGLLEDNLLLVDRETDSIWSQLDSKAISGPLTGQALEVIPSLQTTWAHWIARHPGTRVMVIDGEEGRRYLYRNWVPGTPRPPKHKRPKKHDTRYLGLGLAFEGRAMFLPFRELRKVRRKDLPLRVDVGGRPVTVHYRKDAMTAWAEDAQGNLLSGVLAYDWGWKRFFPETEVFRAW